MSEDVRTQLIMVLSAVSNYSEEENKQEDEVLYTTSLIEAALAFH